MVVTMDWRMKRATRVNHEASAMAQVKKSIDINEERDIISILSERMSKELPGYFITPVSNMDVLRTCIICAQETQKAVVREYLNSRNYDAMLDIVGSARLYVFTQLHIKDETFLYILDMLVSVICSKTAADYTGTFADVGRRVMATIEVLTRKFDIIVDDETLNWLKVQLIGTAMIPAIKCY